jgi:hypothetical protein
MSTYITIIRDKRLKYNEVSSVHSSKSLYHNKNLTKSVQRRQRRRLGKKDISSYKNGYKHPAKMAMSVSIKRNVSELFIAFFCHY